MLKLKSIQLFICNVPVCSINCQLNPDFEMFKGHMKPELIKEINQFYQNIAQEYKVNYIDLYSHFLEDGTDKMNKKYTNDGLHLLSEGYLLWREIVKPYL